jgi:hypothetical protein
MSDGADSSLARRVGVRKGWGDEWTCRPAIEAVRWRETLAVEHTLAADRDHRTSQRDGGPVSARLRREAELHARLDKVKSDYMKLMKAYQAEREAARRPSGTAPLGGQ